MEVWHEREAPYLVSVRHQLLVHLFHGKAHFRPFVSNQIHGPKRENNEKTTRKKVNAWNTADELQTAGAVGGVDGDSLPVGGIGGVGGQSLPVGGVGGESLPVGGVGGESYP